MRRRLAAALLVVGAVALLATTGTFAAGVKHASAGQYNVCIVYSRTGALSKAGSRALRWAAIEAAQCAWRPTNPWNRLYLDVKQRTGKSNPAKSAVAREVLIAAWHVLAREEPFKPSRVERGADPVPASSHFHLAA